jgi:rSAM/selenodomain-associated transferase 2
VAPWCDHPTAPVLSVVLSIVVPVLNEAAGIVSTLHRLAPLRARGHEVIVVDGGSTDATVALATPLVDLVVHSPRGRAQQMNAGAAQARGEQLLFLHADTQLPTDADTLINQALHGHTAWGRFDVRISGGSPWFPVISSLMNWRSRLTGICTGDQGLFMHTHLFRQLNGFADVPLMEDIELSRRLRAVAPPVCLRQRVLTSGRRWEQGGVWRTIVLMWWLRWRYWRGADAHALARLYQ